CTSEQTKYEDRSVTPKYYSPIGFFFCFERVLDCYFSHRISRRGRPFHDEMETKTSFQTLVKYGKEVSTSF
ncbi:unnamed protein product, partial [Larinioides sclopetarius]